MANAAATACGHGDGRGSAARAGASSRESGAPPSSYTRKTRRPVCKLSKMRTRILGCPRARCASHFSRAHDVSVAAVRQKDLAVFSPYPLRLYFLTTRFFFIGVTTSRLLLFFFFGVCFYYFTKSLRRRFEFTVAFSLTFPNIKLQTISTLVFSALNTPSHSALLMTMCSLY